MKKNYRKLIGIATQTIMSVVVCVRNRNYLAEKVFNNFFS